MGKINTDYKVIKHTMQKGDERPIKATFLDNDLMDYLKNATTKKFGVLSTNSVWGKLGKPNPVHVAVKLQPILHLNEGLSMSYIIICTRGFYKNIWREFERVEALYHLTIFHTEQDEANAWEEIKSNVMLELNVDGDDLDEEDVENEVNRETDKAFFKVYGFNQGDFDYTKVVR